MKFTRLLFATTLFASISTMAVAQQASTVIATPDSPVTHGEFKQLLRDTLLEDPEMVMKAIYALRERKEAESQKAAAASFEKNREVLQNDKTSPQVGSTKPDVTVIVFFDYHCGYCKKLLPTLTQLVNNDKNVRVIFREYPILSEDSVNAARAALAVNRLAPHKYFAYHTELMNTRGQFNEAALLAAATKVGVNAEALKDEMQQQAITDMLSQNRKVGEELGVRGTPALFVGDKMLPGAVPYDTLQRVVKEVRTGKREPQKQKKQ